MDGPALQGSNLRSDQTMIILNRRPGSKKDSPDRPAQLRRAI